MSTESDFTIRYTTIAKIAFLTLCFCSPLFAAGLKNLEFITLGPVIRFGGTNKTRITQVAIEFGYWRFSDKNFTIMGADIGVGVSENSINVYCDWQTMVTQGTILPSAGTSIGPVLILRRNKPADFAVKTSLWLAPYIMLIEMPTLLLGSETTEVYIGGGFKFARGLGSNHDYFIPRLGLM